MASITKLKTSQSIQFFEHSVALNLVQAVGLRYRKPDDAIDLESHSQTTPSALLKPGNDDMLVLLGLDGISETRARDGAQWAPGPHTYCAVIPASITNSAPVT